MKKTFTLILLAAASTLMGQGFNDAVRKADAQLQQAIAEYEAVQSEINAKRPELAARLDVIEQEVLALRSEFTNAQRVKASFDTEVSSLERDRQSEIDNITFIQSTLINEYVRRFEGTINHAELPFFYEDIRDVLELLDVEAKDRQDDASIFRMQMAFIDRAVTRLGRTIGGITFKGEASVAGTVKTGSFLLYGPASYFAADDGSTAGITFRSVNYRADIYELPDYKDAITAAVTTGKGEIPVDTTKGEALEERTYDITLLEEIALGGFVMYPIIGLFIAAMLVAVFKLFELMGIKTSRNSDLVAILDNLRQGNRDGALAQARSVSGPVGRMLVTGVEHADQDREVIEEVLYEEIIKAQPKMERYLPFIAVVAATAPLLGLLGTVTGMIKTFKLITIVGTGDAKNLSTGISEALITTKYGLIVAIPSLIFHALLIRKAKGVIGSMEQLAVAFMNGITEIRESKSSDVA